jgi:hypothetical protein
MSVAAITLIAGIVIGSFARELYELWPRRQARPTGLPRAIAIRTIDGEHELELSDGRQYRSDVGVVWYRFPDGYRCNYEYNGHLDLEFERLRRLEKWTNEP